MTDIAQVAIVGAGPYGLALAAHVRAAGVSVRHFGRPMRLWREAMPCGMFLKSQGFASNVSDPDGTHTLEAYCQAAGRAYASYGLPVPLDVFIGYGEWFRAKLVPDLEEALVTDLSERDGEFELTLETGERARARRVVIAAGVEHFAHVPEPLASLPPGLCTHSCYHTDLAAFSNQEVVVVGAGQSALETAALAHENGCNVTLVARTARLAWNGAPLPPDRPLPERLREPESGLGSGWATAFYSNHPELFRHLPAATRVYRARTALGPAGASWLRSRVEGQFPVLTGWQVAGAAEQDGGVRLGLTGAGGATRELAADHVIAATGYRADAARLPFIGDQLRSGLRTLASSPVVGRDYQSSIPGLYFIGPAVAPTFGPVMRFVYGTKYAAPAVARQLTRGAAGHTARPRAAAGVGGS